MPRTRPSDTHSLAMLQQLEPRMVLSSVDVAIVGMMYEESLQGLGPYIQSRSYALEGAISDADVLNYRMFWDGAAGPLPASVARNAPLRFRDDGSFDYESWRWRGSLIEEGAQFLPQDGYAAGWWSARDTEYSTPFPIERFVRAEDQLIVPLAPASTPLSAVGGTWTVAIHERSSHGSETIITGTVTIDAAARLLTWASDRSLPFSQSHITSTSGGSRFTTDAGQQFYLSADGATLIFVDLKNSDGSVHIGVGVRADLSVSTADAAGTYSVVSNNGSPYTETSELTLNPDGTYAFKGVLWHTGSAQDDAGTWFVHSDGQVVLRSSSGDPEDRFVLSSNGASLLHVASGRSGELFAFGTRAVTEPTRHEPVLTVPSTGSGGEALIFIDRTNKEWTVVDVAKESRGGGPAVIGKLVTWFDKGTGNARAAGNTARGVTIFSEYSGGRWAYTVLGELLGTGTVLVGDLAGAPGPGGRMNLFGMTATGDLVRYNDRYGGAAGWVEWNVSELQLEPRGLSTPDFISNLVAYATPWGGLNVAGIDSGGDLQTVWTTTRAGRWFVSNLSANTDAQPFVGDLAVAVGGPAGIFFTAANAAGNLQVISWRPSDGGQWGLVTLPSGYVVNGPIASAFDRTDDVFYIAFIPDGSAETLIYRIPSGTFSTHLPPPWPPAPSPYAITSSAPAEDKLVSDLSVQVGPDGYANVFGQNAAGETVRFKSLFTIGDWTHENLSEIAT